MPYDYNITAIECFSSMTSPHSLNLTSDHQDTQMMTIFMNIQILMPFMVPLPTCPESSKEKLHLFTSWPLLVEGSNPHVLVAGRPTPRMLFQPSCCFISRRRAAWWPCWVHYANVNENPGKRFREFRADCWEWGQIDGTSAKCWLSDHLIMVLIWIWTWQWICYVL